MSHVLHAAGTRVAVLVTADAAGAIDSNAASVAEHHRRALLSFTVDNDDAPVNVTNTTVYMTAPLVAGLLTTALGIFITLVGFCCLFNLTTQAKFEGPDKMVAAVVLSSGTQ
jgi:hypothetical protein